MKKIVVVGAKGQLGLCIKELSNEYPSLDFLFLDSKALDVSNAKQIETILEATQFDYCINCSAYTAVNKAENEQKLAFKINTLGVKFLAQSCKKHQVALIHISTDFVFNGKKRVPYTEKDKTNPISVYGQTKLDGEKAIQAILNNHFIIRTSWLYSQYGSNFVKNMLKLAKTKNRLDIVNDQMGTPTYAIDLAKVIFELIIQNRNYGLYHYSNDGVTTWYDFAKEIFAKTNINIGINPIPASTYPTAAIRPSYSVLDKTKLRQTFDVKIPNWQESLDKCLKALF